MALPRLRGIDISNWEPDVNLKKLNIDFAIFKATEGLTFKDPTFAGYAKQAQKIGLLWGCYHFARNNDPTKEANYFYRVCKEYVGKCIFVLDIEDTKIKDPAKYCKVFCDRFFALSGVRPLIYTYAAYRSRFKGYDSIYKNYDLWLAGYPYTYTSWTNDKCPYTSGKWDYIAMWQFTDNGKLTGCPYLLDLNYAYMTRQAWKAYAKPVKPKK